MEALLCVVAATVGVVLYYLHRGWNHGDSLFSEASAYGTARAESREGSHLDRTFEGTDGAVRCSRCGAANGQPYAFCRRCETPLC